MGVFCELFVFQNLFLVWRVMSSPCDSYDFSLDWLFFLFEKLAIFKFFICSPITLSSLLNIRVDHMTTYIILVALQWVQTLVSVQQLAFTWFLHCYCFWKDRYFCFLLFSSYCAEHCLCFSDQVNLLLGKKFLFNFFEKEKDSRVLFLWLYKLLYFVSTGLLEVQLRTMKNNPSAWNSLTTSNKGKQEI